jgi:A/G-specific adenine glycosylase
VKNRSDGMQRPLPETLDLQPSINRKKGRFQKALLRYSQGGKRRQFPWREAGRTAYEVLIAEVLLKRTTSTAAARVYQAFLARFPNLRALSEASHEEIAESLSRVGLQKQRAIAAKQLAAYLIHAEDGKVPDELTRLLEIPGVGSYTARSVLSMGFGISAAPVDSNVERILTRVFSGLLPDRNSLSSLQPLADELLPRKRYREFNLGLLDLGALICRPAFPICGECPLRGICEFNLKNRTRNSEPKPRAGSSTLGVRLRKVRKEKGFSLVVIARRASLSKLTVIRIERGMSHPLPKTLRKLTAALGISHENWLAANHKMA